MDGPNVADAATLRAVNVTAFPLPALRFRKDNGFWYQTLDEVGGEVDDGDLLIEPDTQPGGGNVWWHKGAQGAGLNNVVEDTSPQMGGDFDVNGFSFISVSNGAITLTPDGTGPLILDGLTWPAADGTPGQVIETDGLGVLSFVTPTPPGIGSLFEDPTPQLGGALEVTGQLIITTSNGDIVFLPDGTGNVVMAGLRYPNTDGSSGQALTTNGANDLVFVSLPDELDNNDAYANGDRSLPITVLDSGNFTFVEGSDRLIDDGTPLLDLTGTTATAGDWIRFEMDVQQQFTSVWWSVDRVSAGAYIYWQASDDAISWRTVSGSQQLRRDVASGSPGDDEIPISWDLQTTEPYLYYRLVLAGGTLDLSARYGSVRFWKREVV